MTDIEKLTEWFEKQVGVKEIPTNNVIYNTHYYGGPVNGSSYPWCCAFVWDGFRECGLSHLFVGGEKTAYCPYVVNYARQHGQWVKGNYRPGDIALYDWDGDGLADHIGFVTAVSGSALTVIEGNTDDAVKRMVRNEVGVMGAYRPAYADNDAATTPDVPPHPASSDTYTVVKGDTLWGIAVKTLGAGERYPQIMTANGLTSDMIYPGQVLVIPGYSASYRTIEVTITNDTYMLLSIMAEGRGRSIGQTIDALLEDAL